MQNKTWMVILLMTILLRMETSLKYHLSSLRCATFKVFIVLIGIMNLYLAFRVYSSDQTTTKFGGVLSAEAFPVAYLWDLTFYITSGATLIVYGVIKK